jgi:hypothetical protein
MEIVFSLLLFWAYAVSANRNSVILDERRCERRLGLRFLLRLWQNNPTILCGIIKHKWYKSSQDFVAFSELKSKIFKKEMTALESNSIKKNKRLSIYTIGWGIGVVLNMIGSDWRNQYLTKKFFIEPYHIEK